MFPKTVSASFLSLCSSIDTPRSLACSLLYKYGEHLQLLELGLDPLNYEEDQLAKFRDDYLVTEYLSKYEGLETGIDTEAAAYASFTAGELSCKAANKRVMDFEKIVGKDLHLGRIITYAQALIEATIRSSPDFGKMTQSSKWGKGSTFSIKGEAVRIDAKVCEDQISVTEQALPFVRAAMSGDIALLQARGIPAEGPASLASSEFITVPGCRATAVPKNAKTMRFIAIEPSGNIFVQLGFGALLRGCLRRAGIDLNDQTINQRLAELAERCGLATIDLKAASDTICWELVWLLLPFRWAFALDSVRSQQILVDGEWVKLHKFSSMGNGFTFELETLIFWALTKAVCDVEMHTGRISVYGDDIICPGSAVRTLRRVMDFCGFTVNTKKTHYHSLFRESCGEHFFGGVNVTPIYQKERLETLEAYYRFHNRWVYHSVDRGAVCGDLLISDKKLRDVIRVAAFNRLDEPHLIPLQGDARYRVLDGGMAVDARRIKKLRSTGYSFRARSWVFEPEDLPGWGGALYAVSLRATSSASPAFTNYFFLAKASEVRRKSRRATVRNEIAACNNKVIGRELAVASDGTVTLRDRGVWVTKHRLYPQACNVRWA